MEERGQKVIYQSLFHEPIQQTHYTYDAENQLTRIDFPGGTFAEYKYDGLGRRIQKNVNDTLTRYVYDQEDILLEYDGTNTPRARYTVHLQPRVDTEGFFVVCSF